ncbi:hypothetical protein GCM10023187_04570 [Nibrella viscosa]|uniref:Cytochrome c domain-containing protein n=1 Tax=Nibrella viscosa TaxID=1084524 RepID=A0ABP8JVS9_9BACT
MNLMRFIILASIVAILAQSCFFAKSDTQQPSDLSGAELATRHCGSCHMLPAPDLLTKDAWRNGVLPQMALRLGMSDDIINVISNLPSADADTLMQVGIYPGTPQMHPADWQKIVAYYTTLAPDSLPAQPTRQPVQPTLSLFHAKPAPIPVPPLVTLIHHDSTRQQLWIGLRNGNLYQTDNQFRTLDTNYLPSTPSDLTMLPNGLAQVLLMGVMDPNDSRKGQLVTVKPGQTSSTTQITPLVNHLHRPVQQLTADFNQDGRNDILVAQFGNTVGKLTLFEQQPNGTYQERILDYAPGTRTVQVHDFNHDGKPDIMALLTQGDESVAIYWNRGFNLFEKQVVLRFPPVYGSSYAELADFNGDGHPDILYTNGDNADYSKILKPYHGVRIFLNDGRNHFRQAWFYPMHGAAKAIAHDFDQDGDLDIAAISMFPDAQARPAEQFIYFTNTGKLRFTPQTFSDNGVGQWMLLEKADYDHDGDLDLLLGSFMLRKRSGQVNTDKGLWLLENQTKQRVTL